MHFRLDKPALELLLEWFFDFPEERIHETLVHGIDPVKFPDDFFSVEFEEPIHHDVLEKSIDNRGVITRPIIKRWIEEEIMESKKY